MTVDELKDWMEDKFVASEKDRKEIREIMYKINSRVIQHDRWLWFLRGAGTIIMVILGLLGYNIYFAPKK